VPSLARKIADVSRLQLVFLSMTWVAGIYVNGFVTILPGTEAGAILVNQSVAAHVVLATISAATSVFLLALAWADGSSMTRVTAFSALAVLAIVVAGGSGISFVLGGGSSAYQSMMMATAFISALFLTFLALASINKSDLKNAGRGTLHESRFSLSVGALALLLFYCVIVSGIYVNLFVAGPVFSLPLARQAVAFAQAKSSAGFLVHEGLGTMLLVTLVVFAVSLWNRQKRGRALVAGVPAGLVAYSAYVGALNLASQQQQQQQQQQIHVIVLMPAWEQLLSSVGLIIALVVTMLLVVRLRSQRHSCVPATAP
jgi:hypothetical protein